MVYSCVFRFYGVGRNGSFDLIVTSDMRTITIGVIPITANSVDHNSDLILEICQLVKEFIYSALFDMRTKFPWMKTMEFEFGICCPICRESPKSCSCHQMKGCMRDACTHFVPEKELPRCFKDPTRRKTVIAEEFYLPWFPKTSENVSSPPHHL